MGYHLTRDRYENDSLSCKPFSPLTAFKNARNPSDCFGGFQSGGLKFGKICQNLKNGNFRTNFDKFWQIFPNFRPPVNINSCPSTQSPQLWRPQKKSLSASFSGKGRTKRDPHGLFRGDFRGEKGSNWAFLGYKRYQSRNYCGNRVFSISKM